MQSNTVSVSSKQRIWLRHFLVGRLKSTFVVPAVGAALMMGAAALPGRADSFVVDTTGITQGSYTSLNAAITALNADTTSTVSNTISFASNSYTFNATDDTTLPPILNSVTIDGGSGVSIDANHNHAFLVGDGTNAVTVSFNNLTIENALAKGGDGGDGVSFGSGGGAGGGGAGLGGAVFVNSHAAVTLNSVIFSDNSAIGGAGGTPNGLNTGGGGGGALNGGAGGGGSAGHLTSGGGSGGGGGLQGNGSSVWHGSPTPDSGGAPGGGIGGAVSGASPGGNGNAPSNPFGGGGGGGVSVENVGGNGGSSTYGGGGGGGTGENGGTGGSSEFGGGGGGAGGGSNAGGWGGWGGFGGGAGAGSIGTAGATGGNGVPGFGGGYSEYNYGPDGNDGASIGGGAGGGGAGFGGAVFVRSGGSLTIEGNTNESGGSVSGGTAYYSILNGSAAGSGIFLDAQNLTFNIDKDLSNNLQTTTINDDIADDGGEGSITKTGAGTLVLGGNNSYWGGTTLEGGTIRMTNDDSLGNSNGDVVVDGGANGQTLDYANGINIANKIVLNADPVFNVDSGTATQSGVISGPDNVVKTGGGTLILNAVNTYGGGTDLQGGTLSISNDDNLGTGNLSTSDNGVDKSRALNYDTSGGDVDISKSITLGADLGLDVDNGTATQSGIISENGGSYGINKTGAGTLILSGINTYSGETTITNGTLENNGTLVSSSVAATNGSIFDNNSSGQVGGSVSVSGSTFNSLGGSVTGAVTLSNGSILHIYTGDASTTPSVFNQVGGVTLNDTSTAIIGGSNGTYSLSSNIKSAFTLNGSSNLVFGSTAEFLDNAAVANYIEGAVGAGTDSTSTIKVLSGGSGGTGSAAGINVITGDLTLNSKSTFAVNTDGSTSTGLQVDGNVDLSLANLQVDYNGTAAPTLNKKISLVEAIGANHSLSNGFNDTVALSGGDDSFLRKYRVKTGVENNIAYLEFLNRLFTLSGGGNQQSFQQYLNNLLNNTDTSGISNLLDLLNSSSDPNIFTNFLGDSYAAFDAVGYQNTSNFVQGLAEHSQNPLYEESGQSGNNPLYELNFAGNGAQGLSGVSAQLSLVKQMLTPRPAMQLAANGNNGDGGNSLWGSVSGNWLHNDGDSSAGSPGWSQNSKSVMLGYQGGGGSFSWGIAGGYHDGDIDFNNRSASGDNDGWNAGLNALWQSKSHAYVNGVLSYGHESNSLTRNDGLGTNKSDFNAKSYAAMLEVGKRIERKTFSFTPYASLLGVRSDRDAFSETGSGSGAGSLLNVNGESHNYLTSTLGVRINRSFLDDSGQTRGGVMLGANWQHQFSGTDFPVTASLNGAMGTSTFTTYGTPLSSNSLGIQVGGYATLTDNLFAFLNYSGNFGGDQKISSVTAGLQYGF